MRPLQGAPKRLLARPGFDPVPAIAGVAWSWSLAGGDSVCVGELNRMERTRQRYGLLLLALALTFFYGGIAEPSALQRTIGSFLVGVSLMLALSVAELSERMLRSAVVLILTIVAGVAVASAAGEGSTATGIVAIGNGLLVALAPPAVVRGVLRNLRRAGGVTITTVAAVLCLYLLVGLFFAFIYAAVENLGGAPFFANGEAATPPRALYFSFITMTTVGFGDFTARTNLGHTLSATEALIGQIYLVTVVATIIGRLVPRRTENP